MEQFASQSRRNNGVCFGYSPVSQDQGNKDIPKGRSFGLDVTEEWPALTKGIRQEHDNFRGRRSFAEVAALSPVKRQVSPQVENSVTFSEQTINILKREVPLDAVEQPYPWQLASEDELWSKEAEKLYFEAAQLISNSVTTFSKDDAENNRVKASAIFEQLNKKYGRSIFSVFSKLASVEKAIAFPEYRRVQSELNELRKVSEKHVRDYQQAWKKHCGVKTNTDELDAQHTRVISFFQDKIKKPKTVVSEQDLVYKELKCLAAYTKGQRFPLRTLKLDSTDCPIWHLFRP